MLAKAAPLATSVSSSLLFQSSAATRDPTGSSDRWQWKAPSGPESLSSVEVNYDQGMRDIAWRSWYLTAVSELFLFQANLVLLVGYYTLLNELGGMIFNLQALHYAQP